MKYLDKRFSSPANSAAYRDNFDRIFADKKTCAGPVYFADQGIQVCETCGGCICCDFDEVDHSKAEYACFADGNGKCHLRCHEGRDCQTR